MGGKGDWPTPLAQLLAGQGPMPFRDFMAEALYAPKHGLYTGRDLPSGRGRPTGTTDYLLSLAGPLAEAFTRFAQAHASRLVEQGPGSGRLARLLLTHLDPALLERTEVVFIEPLLARRTRLVAILRELGVDGKVVGTPRNVDPGPAFVLAKELFSSFPVHWLERTAEGWAEVEVAFARDRWAWEESLDDPPPWLEVFLPGKAQGIEVGHRYEVNAQLPRALGELAAFMEPGVLVVLDRFAPSARGPGGTLRALHGREEVAPYDAPGRAELSAAVDPVALAWGAEEAGLAEVDGAFGLEGLGAPALGVRVFGVGVG